MPKFINLTRVYINKGKDEVKRQPIMVDVESVESSRPRNAVGDRNNGGSRCTLVTKSGMFINVAQKFSEVKSLLEANQ